MFEIEFTQRGVVVQIWGGYSSYSECMAAIRDADSCIPISWDYAIKESGQ